MHTRFVRRISTACEYLRIGLCGYSGIDISEVHGEGDSD